MAHGGQFLGIYWGCRFIRKLHDEQVLTPTTSRSINRPTNQLTRSTAEAKGRRTLGHPSGVG